MSKADSYEQLMPSISKFSLNYYIQQTVSNCHLVLLQAVWGFVLGSAPFGGWHL